jgi:choline kinase
MRKSKDWVTQFDGNTEEFTKAYAEETRQLIADRTKSSDEKTKWAATDGAIREQRLKWRSITNKLDSSLTISNFDKSILEQFLPDVVESQTKLAKAAVKSKQEEVKVEDGGPGRTLVRTT